MDITIRLNDSEVKVLKKRAKKNMLELREMVEDIVRRSCINTKSGGSTSEKLDDSLVGIFSRQQRGRKRGK
jgi:hypothetical protein